MSNQELQKRKAAAERKAALHLAGVTQKEIARRTGYSETLVSRTIRGDRQNPEVLQAIDELASPLEAA